LEVAQATQGKSGVTIARVAVARIVFAGFALLLAAGGPARSDALSDGLAAFRRGDYATAARKVIPLAERGNPGAQALLGFMYEYGRGVPQNAVVAVHWYLCSAEQGNPNAQYQLGLMYDKGQGVPRSAVVAYKWLNLAAAHARPSERDYYLRVRDAVAFKLNAAQIAEAQWLAYNWAPKP
jgi:TPR repeat protein